MNIVFGTVVKVIVGFYIGCTGIATGTRTYIDDNGQRQIHSVQVNLQCTTNTGYDNIENIWLGPAQIKVISQPKREGVK